MAAFCKGEAEVVDAAQRWLIDNGGYDYNCFTFVSDASELPVAGDAANTCASKVRSLAARYGPSQAVVLYGSRTGSELYTDSDVQQAVAVFLLTRQAAWYFDYPRANELSAETAKLLLSDFGAPLGNMTQAPGGTRFTRQYAKANVTLDCATFTAIFET